MICKPICVVLLIMPMVIGMPNLQAGDDDEFAASALKAVNDIEWAEMSVTVVDPDGQPVVGAKVRPRALRAGNGHGWWGKDNYGAPQKTFTDADGNANVVFPKSVKDFERHRVVQVSLFISHADFCTKSAHVDVPTPPNVPQVTLERGFRLRVAGVAPGSDRPLPHCHVMLENAETDEDEFVQAEDGWLKSIPVGAGGRWFRVIHTPPGEAPQFSKPIAWNPDDPASREVTIEVRPGVRVVGTISKDVERPIERGHVVVWCGSPSHQQPANQQQRHQPIWWIDTVPVEADGTFEFSSLPSGYMAQFYAIANDWISAQPTDEAFETCCKWFGEQNRQRHNFFRNGQILRLAGRETQITIEMELAGRVKVKCVDPQGHPLRRVHVSSWPNQHMIGGGSTVFCTARSSLDRLLGDRDFDWATRNPFGAETDENGEALIRNLPAGQQSLHAGNEFWICPPEQKVNSDPEKITEITLKLQSAATDNKESLIEKAKKLLEKFNSQ